MKKIILMIVSACILLGNPLMTGAEKVTETQNVEVEDIKEQEPVCRFSEPEIYTEKGDTVYKTTLSIENVEAIQGYQIQVTGVSEDRIAVEDKGGGTVTPAVYKDGKLNLAVMSGLGEASEKSAETSRELCEITIKYPFSDKEQNRLLTVNEIQIVENVAMEEIVSLGPVSFNLPYVEPPFYAGIGFWVTVGSVLLLVVGAAAYCLKKRKASEKIKRKETVPQWV